MIDPVSNRSGGGAWGALPAELYRFFFRNQRAEFLAYGVSLLAGLAYAAITDMILGRPESVVLYEGCAVTAAVFAITVSAYIYTSTRSKIKKQGAPPNPEIHSADQRFDAGAGLSYTDEVCPYAVFGQLERAMSADLRFALLTLEPMGKTAMRPEVFALLMEVASLSNDDDILAAYRSLKELNDARHGHTESNDVEVG
ncbi:MAG TPA: hypothetical protein VI756_18015 [Blastocatellia bacterium]